jgi:hypothetical protein
MIPEPWTGVVITGLQIAFRVAAWVVEVLP